jgi:uncharacterized membrane protein
VLRIVEIAGAVLSFAVSSTSPGIKMHTSFAFKSEIEQG